MSFEHLCEKSTRNDMMERLTKMLPKIPGTYLVGGSIRDHLLGKAPVDYDLVVPENPREYGRRMAGKMSGHMVEIGKPGQTIVRVVSREMIVDISAMEGKTLAEDLQRRDFTINAMAYELATGKFIDDSGGQLDLNRNVIRMLSPRAFVNDPLRLLRAFRLAACLDFTIEPNTLAAIKNNANLIRKSAGERIKDELFKMLQSDTSHPALLKMADSGLFLQLFPEFGPAHKDPANPSRCRQALKDTFEAYGQLEGLLNAPAKILPSALGPYVQEVRDTAKALLKFCILWHAIGNPAAGNQHNDPQQSDNPARSAKIAQGLCRRYRFANRHTEYINLIIENQMRPFSLFLAHQNNTQTLKDAIRLFMACRAQTPALMLHALADMYGRYGQSSSEGRAFLEFTIHLLQVEYSTYETRAALPPLISGRDLIKEFELSPSPLFKKILRIVEEERLSAQTMTRPEALQMVKDFLDNQD